MNVSQTTQQVRGTVVTELNRHSAMTLRSEDDRTYQIVDCASPGLADELAALTVGDTVSVTLTEAACRGNGWRVTAVDTDCAVVDASLVA
ncbi:MULTISPECIES: hypothetical protein [Halonotius]|nr:hypothetical protein [Halonotius aquaticus]